MIRGLLRRGTDREFNVELTVHRLNNIPVTHRMMFIHWRLSRRDAGSPYYGFTDARPVEAGNCVTWEARIEFTAKISSDSRDSSGKTIMRTPVQLQLRSEKKAARLRIGVPSYNPEGVVELDLAEVAVLGSLDKHFLVQDSLLNATLHVSVKMHRVNGNPDFHLGENSPLYAQSTKASGTGSANTSASTVIPRNMQPSASEPNLPNLLKAIESSRAPGASGGLSRSGSFRGIQQPILTNANANSTRSDAPTVLTMGENFEDERVLNNEEDEVYHVPEPHEVQWPVYEQMFYERIRDSWPDYVVVSKVDPQTLVDDIFQKVCKEDGVIQAREYSTTGSESNLKRIGRSSGSLR